MVFGSFFEPLPGYRVAHFSTTIRASLTTQPILESLLCVAVKNGKLSHCSDNQRGDSGSIMPKGDVKREVSADRSGNRKPMRPRRYTANSSLGGDHTPLL